MRQASSGSRNIEQGAGFDGRHGMTMAMRIAEQRGEDAALWWFREHESLPLHTMSDCPMHCADETDQAEDAPGAAAG